ncbi:hypothetical protein NM688_g6802 [Phlebia brevispora]|uniref:Uncharacterized protein n=1 Tax=Phlebia brevispora TaxID=194682 RepID=A0ACC1SCA7_9APHY|nr:hypothetical protein NM688_g6802 [Phlebia brevispora]
MPQKTTSNILVSAQISSLFPSTHAIPLVIQTKRADLPLPSPSDSEHATFSEVFYTTATGTILLRVLHDGQIVELISLSTDVQPIRFIYPATILSNPSLFWDSECLHLIAVTTVGSLFRVVIPIYEGAPLWQVSSLGDIVIREHTVTRAKGSVVPTLIHVQGIYCVVAGLSDGSLLRLEADKAMDDSEDEWHETLLYHGTFLGALTSFLHSGIPGGSELVCIACHPQPTDIGHIWTLSRDRTLRLWTAAGGCVSAKTLAPTSTGRAVTPAPGSTSVVKPSVLLYPGPQNLLRVFTPAGQDNPCVLVFIPTETSTTSGGFFQLFTTVGEYLQTVKVIECSHDSVHCHLQDFIISSNVLYSLWDKQGQSVVESISLSLDSSEETWQTAAHPPEPELTPAYLDELLLAPGSLTDKFFKAVMRPGLFSAWTLQTAITQYTDACLTLPGTPPSQLLVSYATPGENIAAVVGCTVTLAKDPRTGAPQYDNYWNALKRDWEGFVARCREIERRARWPLALGAGDPRGQILVVERERIGSIVSEDLPLRYQRLLPHPPPTPIEPPNALLEILWSLRTKLGSRCMLSLETRLIDLAHQEIAFPYADIIEDQARLAFRDEVDEGLESWITGRLQSVGDLQNNARLLLDLIGGFDRDVKREEDEVELLLPSTNLEWNRALSASYVTSSVNARYDLSLLLIIMLFFLTDEIQQWDPSLLAEIFVVFRGIAMLRHTTRQPAGAASPQSQDLSAEDDVIVKLRNMNVSTGRARQEPSYSLLHRLCAQFGTPSGLPDAAHHFLDATGLLAGLTPAHASKLEVLFCERLRLLGYREAARDALAWLPRTPAVSYVLLRVWLDEGRYEDAASALESLAGSFGPESGLSLEDSEALAAVLPGAQLFASSFEFYLHAAALFKPCSVTTYEVLFTQLALSVVPHGVSTLDLWYRVIKGLTDLGLYEDAYTALMSSPYDKLKRECASQLVYRMCEEHAVDRLMTFNFSGLADEVEDSLSFKARNADPRIRPFYSRILYTWYTSRGDYRNAALTMYQRARKLAELSSNNPEQFTSLAGLQLEAYLVSMNALSIVDTKSAWIILPFTTEAGNEPQSRKRRKLSKHIPESKYAIGKRDAEVVELVDIQYEHALLSAQLELVRRSPTLLAASDVLLSPASVISKLAQANRFDFAIATAQSLNEDMSEIFERLTTQCLRLSRNPDVVLNESAPDWLLTDRVTSWSGTAADRGWRYLRQALERHDGPRTNYAYTKVTLEVIIGFDRSSAPPPWLIQSLQEHHPEYLIRTYLRFELIESAIEYTLSMVQKVRHIPVHSRRYCRLTAAALQDDARLQQEQAAGPAATWLPYTLIDQVLVAAETQEDLTPRGETLQKELQTEVSNRIKRLQKLSQSSR